MTLLRKKWIVPFVTALASLGIAISLCPFFLSPPSAKRFELVDPEMAPDSLRPLVMEGFYIMKETQRFLPEYAGDALSCANCHFNGGNTLGGINGGIALVGVPLQYPKVIPGNPHYTLQERINDCFERSLNGKRLPEESHAMQAILAYLQWISHDIPAESPLPWLGLPPLKSQHLPNPENGAKIYALQCALCHGMEGEGQDRRDNLGMPPLWGKASFNQNAGFNKLPKLSAFIYYNMPFQDPTLTVEEALDVAAFMISKPHPQTPSK